MATPTCTRASLIAAKGCLNGTVLKTREQLVRLVYFNMLQLAANGGTNYSAAIKTMAADANSLTCGFKQDDFETARLTIAANNATSAGATVPSTRAALADAVRCLESYTNFQLKQMELLLLCKLGRGVNPPS